MIELREQKAVQVLWGIFRFITMGAIIIFSVANLITTGQICRCTQPWPMNETDHSDDEKLECNVNTTYEHAVVHFNAHAWMVAIPVMVMALNVHQGIPFLTHPVKQKKHLGTLMHVVVWVLVVVYMSMGVIVPLWWKDCIIETCSLNWVSDPNCSW